MFTASLDHEALKLASPGVRHAHYQPQAAVRLYDTIDELSALPLDQRSRAAVVGLAHSNGSACSVDSLQGFAFARTFDSLEEYAREFYELLRQVDRRGIETVYLQLVDASDQAAALRDRQLRAAGRA
jgi:hypothetical protein